MKISNEQIDAGSLASMGIDAVCLLRAGDFSGLADRYGYALAYGRPLVAAISEDLNKCLSTLQASGLSNSTDCLPPKVSYFEKNQTGLFALVQVLAETTNGREVLVDLIVTARGEDKWVTLEDIGIAGVIG